MVVVDCFALVFNSHAKHSRSLRGGNLKEKKKKKRTVREKTKEDEETANKEARNTLSEGAQKDA